MNIKCILFIMLTNLKLFVRKDKYSVSFVVSYINIIILTFYINKYPIFHLHFMFCCVERDYRTENNLFNAIAVDFVIFTITILLSILSYEFIEKRILMYKTKF